MRLCGSPPRETLSAIQLARNMNLSNRLAQVHRRMREACAASGRAPDAVRLVAASKTFPSDAIREAHTAGQSAFGENYVQEMVGKIEALADLPLSWHFIGPIQSNKTGDIAGHAHWVHGVDRPRIARRLSEQRPAHLPPLQVCVQVNLSGEASKSGCAPNEVLALCREVAGLPRLALRGLMAMPAPVQPGDDPRPPYRALKALFDQTRAVLGNPPGFDTISAGMSDDFEAAVAEGATVVRVGRLIFGARPSLTGG